MTTGRINQVVYFLFFSLLVLFFSFFPFLFFFSVLSFLILFLFQNDLLVSFRKEISLLLRNVPRFVSFFFCFPFFFL